MTNCNGGNNVYNCFGIFDKSMCYDCIFNADSVDEKKDNFVNYRDRIDIFYQYLKGEKLPEGVRCKMPKLDPDTAFSVIWFLQEILHVLPDNIEQCDGCKELYDNHSSGAILDSDYKNNATGKTLAKKYWGQWCDNCIPDIDYDVK